MSITSASNRPRRVGVIGVGRFGRHYVRLVPQTPGLALAAAASRNAATAPLLPPGCRLMADWRELLNPGLLDGVIIATPPALHAEMTLAALEAGLAALVEKPLTLSSAEAERVAEAAARTGGTVLVNHIQVINPAWQALKEHLPLIGPLREMRSEGGNLGPFRPDTPPLWDYGSHDVSLALDLFAAGPDAMTAAVTARRPEPGACEAMTAEARLLFGKVPAVLRFGNLMTEKVRRVSVRGEGGTLTLDDLAPHKLQFVNETGAARPLPYPPAAPLDAALQRFAAAMNGESPHNNDVTLGVAVVRCLERLDALLGLAPAAKDIS